MVDWPHAPVHRFAQAGIYFVTGATLYKQHFYRSSAALDALQELLFSKAREFGCWLQAWAFFSNHNHLVLQCEAEGQVHPMLSQFHSGAAVEINRRDGPRRQVWYQFRDTQLTFEKSWLARLRYTHENAVHHDLVVEAKRYRWCSASWFEREAKPSFVKTVKQFKIDRVNVYDDFGDLPR
jgi:putative transposase